MHIIKLEKFEGPLQLLYQLIEEGEMEITDLVLGKVTEDFLNYLDQSTDLSPDELADFLVVATKLLLLKSKALLPQAEFEVEEGPSLEEQLKMYREFVLAAKQLEERIKTKNFVYFKPPLVQEKGFYPPPAFSLNQFPTVFRQILERLEPVLRLPQTSLEKVISIKDKIKHIYHLLKDTSELTFSHLSSLAATKTEIIISFLALLELVKQRDVTVEQESLFKDIIISRA